MGSRLFTCLALWLLMAGPVDPRIDQTPKHLVTLTGNERTLTCAQYLNHNAMYWYRQSAKKSLELMFSYNYQALVENQTVPHRFQPHNPEKSQLDLRISALEPDDSATYFCASSQDTALQRSWAPVHKPPQSTQETAAVAGPPEPRDSVSGPQDSRGNLRPQHHLTTRYHSAKFYVCTAAVFDLRHAGPEVIQFPSHQVTHVGQSVTLSCDPVSSHLYFFWYKQTLGQQMEFLVSFYNGNTMDKSELFKEDRFSVERQDDSYFTLKIQPTTLKDSALYLCASSLATALQKHLLPMQKPS